MSRSARSPWRCGGVRALDDHEDRVHEHHRDRHRRQGQLHSRRQGHAQVDDRPTTSNNTTSHAQYQRRRHVELGHDGVMNRAANHRQNTCSEGQDPEVVQPGRGRPHPPAESVGDVVVEGSGRLDLARVLGDDPPEAEDPHRGDDDRQRRRCPGALARCADDADDERHEERDREHRSHQTDRLGHCDEVRRRFPPNSVRLDESEALSPPWRRVTPGRERSQDRKGSNERCQELPETTLSLANDPRERGIGRVEQLGVPLEGQHAPWGSRAPRPRHRGPSPSTPAPPPPRRPPDGGVS